MALHPVTVVIPTNSSRSGKLERAINSAQAAGAAQTVVVDDASGDPEVHRLATSHGCTYVLRPKNGGVAAAQNSGVLHASQPHTCFLHSDDVLAIDRFELQLIGATSHSIVSGQLTSMGCEDLLTSTDTDRVCDATLSSFKRHQFGVHISRYLFPTSLIRSVRFDEKMRAWEDWDLLFRLRLASIDFIDLRAVVASLERSSGDRLSASPEMAKGLIHMYRKYGDILNRKERAIWAFKIGRAEHRSGGHAASWFARSFQLDPLHPRRIVLALKSRPAALRPQKRP